MSLADFVIAALLFGIFMSAVYYLFRGRIFLQVSAAIVVFFMGLLIYLFTLADALHPYIANKSEFAINGSFGGTLMFATALIASKALRRKEQPVSEE